MGGTLSQNNHISNHHKNTINILQFCKLYSMKLKKIFKIFLKVYLKNNDEEDDES